MVIIMANEQNLCASYYNNHSTKVYYSYTVVECIQQWYWITHLSHVFVFFSPLFGEESVIYLPPNSQSTHGMSHYITTISAGIQVASLRVLYSSCTILHSCSIIWLFLCSKHYAITNHTCNFTPQSIVFSFKDQKCNRCYCKLWIVCFKLWHLCTCTLLGDLVLSSFVTSSNNWHTVNFLAKFKAHNTG